MNQYLKKRARRACTSILLGLACAAPPVLAQTADPAASSGATQLQPIIVTAERRQEDIKSVPVAVTTLGDEKLDVLNSGGQDLEFLASRVPSLNVESSFGRSYPRFYIRGYGNVDFHQNASQPVSMVYDDVVLESSVLKGFPAFDLAQIEVLRGPQGTLFGRNTPAGVIKFDSNKPDLADSSPSGYANLSTATYHTTNLEGALNLPINAEWAARVSVLSQHRNNWIGNSHTEQSDQYGGYDDDSFRGQLLYVPDTDFSALFNVHARTMNGSASLFRANIIQKGTDNLVPGFDVNNVQTDGRNGQTLKNYGGNLRLQWKLGGLTLYSITGVETVQVYSRGDIDGGYGASYAPPYGPGFIPFSDETADGTSHHRQITQELRAESNYTGPFNWQSGLYYFHEDYLVDNYTYDTLGGGDLTDDIKSRQTNTALALFGSVRYDLTSDFNVRAGVRYTRDDKQLVTNPNDVVGGGSDVDQSAGLSASPKSNKISWDASAGYALGDDTHLYVRLANAFRGSTVEPASQFNPMSVAKPETTTSFEVGLKTDFFDHRARLDFDVYDYQVKDQQLTAVGGDTGNASVLLNAKKTVGRGAEFDLDAYLADHLLWTLGGSYNFTEIQDPNLAVAPCGDGCTVLNPAGPVAGTVLINGNPLPQAPRWVANTTMRYGYPFHGGELFAYTDWAYRSDVNFTLYKSIEFVGKPMLTGGLRAGYNWDSGKYEAAFFGRNITNQIRLVGGLDFNNLTGFVNDYNPRIWGLQFKERF